MCNHPRVCVVGSINMDMVTTTRKIPMQGETVMGENFKTYPGGKGANQAVAAAKLGADVTMIGAVGDDASGKSLMSHFELAKVGRDGIQVIPNVSTGVATIILSDNDNRIIVAPGANNEVTPELVKRASDQLLNSDIIILQFEIPMETIEFTVDFASKHGIPVIINPAPYADMSKEILNKVTYLTPNDVELAAMKQATSIDPIKNKLIVTRGDQGVQFIGVSGDLENVPSYNVEVKDTTGAGDTFNGALATELARTNHLERSIKFANAAAALSIQRLGAQGGMPTRAEVEQFIEERADGS